MAKSKKIVASSGQFLGRQIRELRLSLGLEQTQFAERIGVSRPVVSNWENENTRPLPEHLIKMGNLATSPGMCMWFWKEAGVDRGKLQDAASELLRERIETFSADENVRIPMLVAGKEWEETESSNASLLLPRGLVPNPVASIAVRIADDRLRPLLRKGAIVVIDQSEKDVRHLLDGLVAFNNIKVPAVLLDSHIRKELETNDLLGLQKIVDTKSAGWEIAEHLLNNPEMIEECRKFGESPDLRGELFVGWLRQDVLPNSSIFVRAEVPQTDAPQVNDLEATPTRLRDFHIAGQHFADVAQLRQSRMISPGIRMRDMGSDPQVVLFAHRQIIGRVICIISASSVDYEAENAERSVAAASQKQLAK